MQRIPISPALPSVLGPLHTVTTVMLTVCSTTSAPPTASVATMGVATAACSLTVSPSSISLPRTSGSVQTAAKSPAPWPWGPAERRSFGARKARCVATTTVPHLFASPWHRASLAVRPFSLPRQQTPQSCWAGTAPSAPLRACSGTYSATPTSVGVWSPDRECLFPTLCHLSMPTYLHVQVSAGDV